MPGDDRIRLSLSGSRLRHRRHQRALRPGEGAGRGLGEVVHLRTGDYPGLAEAIEAAAPKLGARPHSMIACGAGPVVGRTLKLTNAPWVMDGPEAARRTGLETGLLLNDFEAQALSLPTIPEVWERRIGPLPVQSRGPAGHPGARAPGSASRRWSRRTATSPRCRRRPAILISARSRRRNSRSGRILNARMAAITSESVLTGAGLARVHRARMMAKGAPDPHLDAAAVTAAALADPNGEAAPVFGSTGGSWRASPATWR